MSTTATTPATVIGAGPTSVRQPRTITPIPLARLVKVELRKMFDTRAGFWLIASVLIAAVLATAAVILWAPDEAVTQETFSTAIGMPLSVVLPILAILSVTSEYSQRTGLTTYTLVPWRGRVIAAKVIVTLAIGVAAMLLSLAVGAAGNVLGAAITGLDPVWDITLAGFAQITLAMVLGMLIGFTLGVLFRSSAAAVVGYFVYALVLPGALGALAAFQQWFEEIQPWVDVNYAMIPLYDGAATSETWAQLGVTTVFWLWIPLALGLRAVVRAEVK